MKIRCFNKNSHAFARYGGRGITVCGEWMHWPTFLKWALSHGFAEDLQLDRIDNDGNYEPSNCRWVSGSSNCCNRSTSKPVTAFGETKTLSEWAQDVRCLVSEAALRSRILFGHSPEVAMSTPKNKRIAKPRTWRMISAFGETKSLTEWSKDPRCQVTRGALHSRLADNWPAEHAITAPQITPEQRSEIGRKAASKRWHSPR